MNTPIPRRQIAAHSSVAVAASNESLHQPDPAASQGKLKDSASIYRTLRHGSLAERMAFVGSLPDDYFKTIAITLLGSDKPGVVVVTLGALSTNLCAGQHAAIGAELAHAVHRLGVEILKSKTDPGLLPVTVSGIAASHINACSLLGRSAEVLLFAREYIDLHDGPDHLDNVRVIKIARIAALLNLNRIDEAKEALGDKNLRGGVASDMDVAWLEKRVSSIAGSITQTPGKVGRSQSRRS